MEKVNFKYSIKNIPIPSERAYLLQLNGENWSVYYKNALEIDLLQQQNKL